MAFQQGLSGLNASNGVRVPGSGTTTIAGPAPERRVTWR